MIFNPTISGGGSGKSDILVYAPTGSTVTVQRVAETPKTAVEKDGVWTFKNCGLGTWTVNASLNGQTATDTVVIQEDGQLMRYEVFISYGLLASDFDWSEMGVLGTDYQIVDDSDVPISQSQWASSPNWKCRVLVSGIVTALKNGTLNVFCVGGGGAGNIGGGGGGYTKTSTVEVIAGTRYAIVIGAGGIRNTNGAGGETSAFSIKAAGGLNASSFDGANGGSGGGAFEGGAGGFGGSNGGAPSNYNEGKGQIAVPGTNGESGNTREFGEATGKLYAGGGGASSNTVAGPGGEGGGGDGAFSTANGIDGEINTGGGGGGKLSGNALAGNGGCGIVVFRNARGGSA